MILAQGSKACNLDWTPWFTRSHAGNSNIANFFSMMFIGVSFCYSSSCVVLAMTGKGCK